MRRLSMGAAALLVSALMAVLAAPAQAATSTPCAPTSAHLPKLPAAAFDDGPTFSRADLVADFDAWMTALRTLNPDLSIRADVPRLTREAGLIRKGLTTPLSRRAAWLRFAQLNPYLGDGHAGIFMPDYRGALAAHLNAGGRITPIEVRFASDGSLRVFTVAPGVESIGPGDRVLSVNGHRADRMVAAMLALSPGDSPGQQHAWVARRFAMLFWYLYGDTGRYDLAIQPRGSACPIQVRAPGATTLPSAQQPNPKVQDLFAWRILAGNVGYLRVDSFDPGDNDALAAVAQAAFTGFKQAGVHALIIDVRENGGGDDPLWQRHLMDHITTKPYAQLSHYEVRVTKDNAGPGDVVGDVQQADYTKRFTPDPIDPIRFNGPVYILGGPYSYSATIQFMVAAQDFGLAKIAGEETAALSCQTGQTRSTSLPKTGLSAVTPIIAYTRPSGHGCKRGVIPDVPIPGDEVKPDDTLDALLAWIVAQPAR